MFKIYGGLRQESKKLLFTSMTYDNLKIKQIVYLEINKLRLVLSETKLCCVL